MNRRRFVSPLPVIAVTAGLMVAGVFFGALAGVAALAISLWLSAGVGGLKPEVFAIAATLGGVAGWFLPQFARGDGILVVAAVGVLCAAVWMRLTQARDARVPDTRDPGS